MIVNKGSGISFAFKIFDYAEIEWEQKKKEGIGSYLSCTIGKQKFSCLIRKDEKCQIYGKLAINEDDLKKTRVMLFLIQDGSNVTAWVASSKALKQFVKSHTPHFENGNFKTFDEKLLLDNVLRRVETLPKEKILTAFRSCLR